MKHLFKKEKNRILTFFSIVFLFVQTLSINAQCTETLDDFETNRKVTYSNAGGTLTQNAVNPASNYVNSSAACAKYERSAIPYDGISGLVTVGDGDYYRDKRKVFKMDVYSAYAGMEVKITLANSTQSQLDYPKGRHSEYTALTTKTNQWETLTFTWQTNPDAALAGDLVNQVIIQFASGVTGTKTIYIDNFTTDYLLIWDDFDNFRNAAYKSQDGTRTTVTNPAPNTINSSSKCARYIRNAAVQNDMIVAGSATIGQADNYKNGYYNIKMAVYSPASGIPIKLLLNKSSITATQAYPAGTHSYYTSTTTKANEWEILTFAYSGQPDATVASSGVDEFAIQFAPTTSTGATFYFDDLLAVLTKPAAPSAINGPAAVCKNQTGVVYSVTNVAGLTYTWLVPPGATIVSGTNTNSITVNYGATAANGFVAVKAANAVSCGEWKGVDVIISPATPTVDAGTPISTCQSVNSVALNGTIAGTTGGIWSSPTGGTFTSTTNLKASYTLSQADKTNGSVTLTLTTTGGCSTASSTVLITIAACTDLSVSIPSNKYCAGNTFTATYTSTNTFNSGNIFVVQLSNPSGTFSSFTNIGSLTSITNTGQITCTLPLAPTPGNLYRVRVIATNPSITGVDNGADIAVGYVLKPDFYADKYKIQVGETTILRRSSSATANCSWILGSDSVPELPFSCLTQTVSYTTPGQRLAYLIAYDANGCSAKSYAQYIDVYSCNPTVPADAYIVTGNVTDHISNYGTVWVKPGGSYTSKSFNQVVYVSSGGSYTMTSNTSINLAYLEAFSSFDGALNTSHAVIVYDPNAGMINVPGATLIPCNSLSLSEGDLPTSLQKAVHSNVDVVVYPNPTNGNFSIKSTNAVIFDVTVVNTLGQTEVHTGETITTDMKGLLVIKINTDKGIAVRRINVTE